MKKVLLLIVAIAAVALSFTKIEDDKKGIARVQRFSGKEIYVLSEPIRDYDVVDRMTTEWGTSFVGQKNIQKQMQEIITRALNRVEKGKTKDFDAVLTDDGDKMTLIKFKE